MLPDTSREACERHLEPYGLVINRIVAGAFELWAGLPPTYQAIYSETKRAKANVISAHLRHLAARELGGLPGIVPHTKYESTTYEVVDGQIELRIKKVNARGYSSNYPTKRARSFHNLAQFEIFEKMWSAPIRVDIGYIPDALGQKPAQILVVYRRGRDIIWSYRLDTPEEGGAVVIPITPTTSPVAPARVVAKAETQEAKQDNTSGGEV